MFQLAADKRKKRRLVEEFRKRNLTLKPRVVFDKAVNDAEDVTLFEWSDLEVRLGQLDEVRIYISPLLLEFYSGPSGLLRRGNRSTALASSPPISPSGPNGFSHRLCGGYSSQRMSRKCARIAGRVGPLSSI
jgi:hypothetical protein